VSHPEFRRVQRSCFRRAAGGFPLSPPIASCLAGNTRSRAVWSCLKPYDSPRTPDTTCPSQRERRQDCACGSRVFRLDHAGLAASGTHSPSLRPGDPQRRCRRSPTPGEHQMPLPDPACSQRVPRLGTLVGCLPPLGIAVRASRRWQASDRWPTCRSHVRQRGGQLTGGRGGQHGRPWAGERQGTPDRTECRCAAEFQPQQVPGLRVVRVGGLPGGVSTAGGCP
jgi:hypothetical protein